ncbi:siderophore-interacting protein [Amycolatopsis sp.]|uniref:siderophore-interacting protein n=1 Tax=Amycolatopsis sp. TaxID=37632 RepID=UPI002CD4B91D|nr:siderophore-interacting protein [Amycolatopsis sp.]HVV10748.1 siderophore-interacting protein [Amycolatopsis sp.]
MDVREAQVTAVRRVTPGMARVSFAGDELHLCAGSCADAYLKLFFPLPGQEKPQLPDLPGDTWYRTYLAMPDEIRPPMRTYTIREHRGSELDIDFVLHGDGGPASRWANRVQPGDHVALIGPGGLHVVPEQTDWQLLVGDETALPAIGAILADLPRGAVARAYIEIDDLAEEQELATDGDVEINWVHRGSSPHGAALLSAVREAKFPDGAPYAWISGEAGMVKYARRHLVRERGVDKRAITFTGYWRKGVNQDDDAAESLRKYEAGEPLDED